MENKQTESRPKRSRPPPKAGSKLLPFTNALALIKALATEETKAVFDAASLLALGTLGSRKARIGGHKDSRGNGGAKERRSKKDSSQH